MKIYLAGPMSGLPQYNFPAFYEAARKLRAQGHTVFNPAEQDMKRFGTMKGLKRAFKLRYDEMRRRVMKDDLNWILKNAEAIAILPGWRKSPGAVTERALGKYLKIPIIYLR